MKISDNFLDEFLKACIVNKNFFETVKKHLKYELIQSESHKHIWKFINTFYINEDGKIPTFGIITENFKEETNKKKRDAISETIARIKESYVGDLYEEILSTFESYLKNQRFKSLYSDVADLYEEGKKEEAINKLAKESVEISEFSLSSGYYEKIFEGFEQREEERKKVDIEDISNEKIPTGIHAIDYDIKGGHKRGSIFGFLARSGGGKSTALRWCALHAARHGYNVFYFTCEGTRKDTANAFDAAWTATPIEDMEIKGVSEKRIKSITKSLKSIKANGGEIIIQASEKFDSLSIEDCYNTCVEFSNSTGKNIDLVLFDYMEIFQVNGHFGGESGERRRREKIVERMSNLATELNCAVGTATQANDVKEQDYNNPDKVLTRSDIAEFKGAIKPFAYFYTINQTDDEVDADVARIFNDKFRFHKSKQTNKIATSFNIGRFYNSKRTIQEFWDIESNKSIV